MGALNEVGTGAFALGVRSGLQSYGGTTATVGVDNIVVERFTDGIIGGTSEATRIGSDIRMMFLQLDIMFAYVGVQRDYSITTYPFNEPPLYPGLRVRTMIVYEDDAVEDNTAKHQPPTLQDIFQGCSASLGSAVATASPENMYKIMYGTYKPKDNASYTGALTSDTRLMRQRNFDILYDNSFDLNWGRTAGGLHISDASETKADILEQDSARHKTLNIRLAVNRSAKFMTPSTTSIQEVKGNLYLYVFGTYASPTGDLWPDGGPAPVTPPTIAAMFRTRSMLFWRDHDWS